MATQEQRRQRLQETIAQFTAAIVQQPDDLFLQAVDGRTPRDIVAHLIGWNYHMIDASQAIARGEVPASLLDPEPDFRTTNAGSMARFNSRDKAELLTQLRESAIAYDQFLRDLPSAEWEEHHGTLWNGHPVTNRGLAGAMIHDFTHHREEIERWTVRVG